jgi:hypothetical protein
LRKFPGTRRRRATSCGDNRSMRCRPNTAGSAVDLYAVRGGRFAQVFRCDGCPHASNISGVTCWPVLGSMTIRPCSTSSRTIFARRRRTVLMLFCRRASLRLGKPRSLFARAAASPALRCFNRKAVSLVKRPSARRVSLIGRKAIEKQINIAAPTAIFVVQRQTPRHWGAGLSPLSTYP